MVFTRRNPGTLAGRWLLALATGDRSRRLELEARFDRFPGWTPGDVAVVTAAFEHAARAYASGLRGQASVTLPMDQVSSRLSYLMESTVHDVFHAAIEGRSADLWAFTVKVQMVCSLLFLDVARNSSRSQIVKFIAQGEKTARDRGWRLAQIATDGRRSKVGPLLGRSTS